ncbi:hypothetical protein BH10PLA2_BH10PLA2_10520 [soil metagenome]
MSESEEIIDRYRAGTDDVRSAFADLSREQLIARPVPGKWSSLEVLCHLVDTDLRNVERIRTALTSEKPRIPGVSIEQLTAMIAVDGRDAAEEMDYFRLIRSEMARILRALPPTAMDRGLVLVKPDGTEAIKTVGQLVGGITAHAVHHLRFVEEKRRLLGVS